MIRGARWRQLPNLLAGLLIACADAPPEAGPALPGAATWKVSAEPTTRVGGTDERPGYLITALGDATRLSDGRIVVADMGARELRFYAPDGEHLRTAGGPGEGPGEFGLPTLLVREAGDTVLVLDDWRGISRFSPDGDFLDAYTFSVFGVGRHECRGGEGARLLIPGGRVLSAETELDGSVNPGCPSFPEGVFRMTALLGGVDPRTGGYDTLAILPADELDTSRRLVYGRGLSVAVAGGRVFAGDTGADSIRVFHVATGERLASRPAPFEARPIPPEARAQDAVRRRMRDGTERAIPFAYPASYPRFARVVGDSDGNVWVMRYPDVTEPVRSDAYTSTFTRRVPPEGALWRVVAPDGSVIAEVRTPPHLFVLEIGPDWLLGVREDELDRQSVEVWGLDRHGGPHG